MSKRLIDLVIYADGIILYEDEEVEDIIEYLEEAYSSQYAFTYAPYSEAVKHINDAWNPAEFTKVE